MLIRLLILIAYLGMNEGAIETTEALLLNSVLKGYNKLVRPVTNLSLPVDANFGIELIQLIKVDDRNQLITTKVWIRQSWTNMLMKWNSSEWDNIGHLQVEGDDVWIPDIILYDNAAGEHAGGVEKYKTQVILYANGLHFWMSPAVFTSTCKIDIKYFPFDRQICNLKFGSWTYDKSGINLRADQRNVITSQYINSSEWDISRVEKEVNVLYYGCCPDPYVDVTFKIIMQRKPLFYLFNVIAPCLILSLTILFGFFFPPESGERISLTITILLAIAVFMQMISGTLPVNSDGVPKLALFYMVILVESASSLATTCIVLIFHYRGGESEIYPMPQWVRKYFIQILARKFGYLPPNSACVEKQLPCDLKETKNENQYEKHEEKHAYDNNVVKEKWECKPNETPVYEYNNLNENWAYTRNEKPAYEENNVNEKWACTRDEKPAHEKNNLNEKWANKRKIVKGKKGKGSRKSRFSRSPKLIALQKIQKDVRKVVTNLNEKDRASEINEEWKILGKVLDQIFFTIFLFTVTISAVSILLPAYLLSLD